MILRSTGLACLFALSLASIAQAKEYTFQSTGFGRVFYEPEAFDLSFGVMTHRSDDLQEVRKQHQKILNEIAKVIKDVIPQDKLINLRQSRTRLDTNLRDLHSSSKTGDPAFTFTSDYVVRVADPELLIELQGRLVEIGVNRIQAVQEFSPKLEEYVAQARKLAIADAKAKAALIAGEVDWELGPITSVAIQAPIENDPGQQHGNRVSTFTPDQPPLIAAQVSATVTLSYIVTPKQN